MEEKQKVPRAKVSNDDKKKRGRKPKLNYEASTENIENFSTTCLSDDENVIVKLNVTEDKTILSSTCDDDTFNDDQPCPYNSHEYSTVQKIPSDGGEIDDDRSSICGHTCPQDSISTNLHFTGVNGYNKLKVAYLLKDFEEKNKNNEWPLNTSVACYWCCHKFNTVPFGIPIEYVKNTLVSGDGYFRVFGCFCSLECAAAHNFNSTENHDEIWERNNLINMLARQIGHKSIVKPAPNRLSLKYFGGFMDIDQFRAYCDTGKLIHVNFPPMMSMTQQIEEVNEYEINSELRYIPVDNERISRYKEKIIFKRPKSNAQDKSILEHAMNMKFATVAS